ncbi:2-hydroxyacid dehydrogenase [Larkinella soli]|uniref:2-hydroxyacid dehydrogenase n=1 Tax=Larkinella soli TaxID=1770527 RepID=UPI000FFB9972|nr:2-hydroxyacid dehydrogenase [Larkinella soli]
MKVALFSCRNYDRQFFERMNTAHQITYIENPLNPQTVPLAAGSEAVCVFVNDHLDRPTLEALAGLGVRLVALRCAGFNNVDLAAATELNMRVVRVPAYSPHAVAEHAVALLLTLNRKIHRAYNRIRENNFSLEGLLGFDLYGKTIGVIGTGKIGAVFAQIMLGFGCRVIAFDQYENEDLKTAGVGYTDLPTLLRSSDVISLHCPLTPETHHLIDAEALAQTKPGVMLLNTSRGALVDTKAVIRALKTGHLGALALDVYELEENVFFHDLSGQALEDDLLARLMTFPNVLITSHQGFFTHEALEQITRTTLNSITAFEREHSAIPAECVVV